MPGYYVPKFPMCPLQIACEGTQLKEGREICGKCEEKLAKKNKPLKLKGSLPTNVKKKKS
jgi:hypothetical protein